MHRNVLFNFSHLKQSLSRELIEIQTTRKILFVRIRLREIPIRLGLVKKSSGMP